VVYFQFFLVQMDQSLFKAQQIFGFMVIGLAILTVAWILWESKNSFQRLWGALILWQCIIVLIDVFRGGLY
jgi:glucose dehydrogenase